MLMNSFLVSSEQNFMMVQGSRKNKIAEIFRNKNTQEKILQGLTRIEESPQLIKFILEFYQVKFTIF